jgi:hypothetical protein
MSALTRGRARERPRGATADGREVAWWHPMAKQGCLTRVRVTVAAPVIAAAGARGVAKETPEWLGKAGAAEVSSPSS